ncbi:hypothetical protein [Salinimicrobium soli]|uniref:hypothetical protein n=1 Tax=Salinimicrobium soli TaxID=1254399 RepID=UPI003AABBDD2
MERVVKDRLAKFFSLPVELITEEADLYILSVLSLYFREEQGKSDNIKISDVDVEKLCLSRNDLVMDEEGSKLDIYLNHLLNKSVPTEIREKSCFKDHIGRDGFTRHLLETVLCIMEISKEFNCDFMEFPEDDEKQMTVNDLIQFVVLQNNSRAIKD